MTTATALRLTAPITHDLIPTTATTAPRTLADALHAGLPFPTETHRDVLLDRHIIEIGNFDLFYGRSRALYSIDMRIPAAKVTALIGPSGCGKSTLLRSVNRLNELNPSVRTQGNIYLNSEPLYSREVDVIELRKRVGMVFQKPNPFPLSVFENVVYALRIAGERRRDVLADAAERALRAAALWDEVKDRLKSSGLSLSGGQQQRLCIARAIAARPDVLLMDEPTSALDPLATARIEDLIRSLRQHYTVLIVTHNMQQAARLSDYTAFMYLGRLVEYGPTPALFHHPHLPETHDYITGRFG